VTSTGLAILAFGFVLIALAVIPEVSRRKVHYAWAIVVLASLMRLSSSAVRTSFSILVPRLVEAFGWSYGAIGFALALQWIFSGLFGPLAGWIGDRYGIRRTLLLGTILFTIAMILTGRMNHLWELYLWYGILLSAALAIFQVPLMAAVSMWFQKHLGVGMGILQSSQGMGPLLFVPLVLFIIAQFDSGVAGLRAAFWITGIGGGVVMLLLIRPFFSEPAAIGLRALGASGDEPIRRTQQGKTAKLRTDVFLQQAKRTSAFWNLIGIHFWGCAGHAIIMVFLVAIAEDRGLGQGPAAATFVIMSLFSTTSRFGVPIIADRMGSKGAMGVCFFLQSAPIVILFFAHDPWMFYVFSALFGIGFGGEMSAFPIINRQYYGSAPIGTAYGWQMMGAGIGMGAGALVGGWLRNWTGDFDATIILSLVLSLVGVAAILMLPTTSRHLIPHWEEALPQEARATG
jgi:MFS family permease